MEEYNQMQNALLLVQQENGLLIQNNQALRGNLDDKRANKLKGKYRSHCDEE